MKWRVSGAGDVETAEAQGTRLWRILLAESSLQNITIGICLLWNDLVSSVDLLDGREKRVLRIMKGAAGRYRATVMWERECPAVTICPQELESWMFFFLHTVRDGFAVVTHIDLETRPGTPGQQPGDFMIEFPLVGTPLSDEARKWKSRREQATRSEVEEEVRRVLKPLIQRGTAIKEEHRLAADLKMASDDATAMAVALQHRFRTRIPRAEWESVETVQDVIDLLVRSVT
jgi:acyl carrier protein